MKELEIISTIQKVLSSEYIGDDCAYLKDLNIVVTQDSLVEDVHFSRKFSTPYQLGYKSIAVNLSDIYASGAQAKYLTVSLSLPKDIETNFIKEFYEGAKSVLNGAKIVGGDITGSDKIYISVTAIGSTKDRKISSRKNARNGYKIITNGYHGSSSAGLFILQNSISGYENLVKEHLMPSISSKLSDAVSKTAKNDYAMMDSSDGLMDSLLKIADSSNVKAKIYFDKILYDKDIKTIENFDYKNAIFFGGEDYKLVCAISPEDLKNIDSDLYFEIGEIVEKTDNNIVEIQFNEKIKSFDKKSIENKLFNHF